MDVSGEEEFAPLFDYSRVQPAGLHCLSDDDSDASPVVSKSGQKRKNACLKDEHVRNGQGVAAILDEEGEAVGKKNNDEEDWLPPPPKVPNVGLAVLEDETLRELRSTKLELASLAQAAKDLLKSVTEHGKNDVSIEENSAVEVRDKSSKQVERKKIVISIQEKDGQKQFRLHRDDNFEGLFKMYAEKLKLKLEGLTFSFDGERVSPSATPASLGLENDDIIEVHIKSL